MTTSLHLLTLVNCQHIHGGVKMPANPSPTLPCPPEHPITLKFAVNKPKLFAGCEISLSFGGNYFKKLFERWI